MRTYQDVVKATFKQHKSSKMTPQAKMKLASQTWKKVKGKQGKKGKGMTMGSMSGGGKHQMPDGSMMDDEDHMEGEGFEGVKEGFMSVMRPAFKIGMALAPML
tara:strand:- start:2463 stop:2771 length:309 start_codon:yes stop_codon:yes gene_type:complete